MPASLPGSTDVQNQGNPNLGHAVAFSPFSGPKGSPFDARKYPPTIYQPKLSDVVADPLNLSTGALSTGIGFGVDARLAGTADLFNPTSKPPTYGVLDDSTPGITLPNGVAATTAILLAIGGGKSVITAGPGTDWSRGTSAPVPYVAQPLLAAGNGGSRDAGAGPAFTGFGAKVVTATAPVANAAVIETGFTNRSGVTIPTGLSQFGSSTTASPAVT
jgi:hypothetical protein